MNLRPLNPYYRRTAPSAARAFSGRKMNRQEYSYPYVWQKPVTDRSQEDVDHARQILSMDWEGMEDAWKTEYLAGLKGCLNREDLERIENNIQILLDVLEIDAASGVGKVPDIPDTGYFARIKENVSYIRAAYCIHETTPPVPELPYNTWQKYNDLEQILADVYEVVSAQFHYYAGELYAGDLTGLVL